MFDIISLLLSLALIMFLAYKGYSTMGMIYLTYERKKALKNGETYGFVNNNEEKNTLRTSNILIAVSPILLVFASNLFLSKIYYPNVNGDYLKDYGLTLEKTTGTWSVIIALLVLTASASGGLGITLDALAAKYLEMSAALGIPPSVLHRIAFLSCGGLDTLPHNGAVITTLSICGLTQNKVV